MAYQLTAAGHTIIKLAAIHPDNEATARQAMGGALFEALAFVRYGRASEVQYRYVKQLMAKGYIEQTPS